MSSKQKDFSNKIDGVPGEDFKIIRGIGPGIEERLHKNGILTYAQLAALSPADITALLSNYAGVTTEKIVKQDWTGQAQALATGQQPISVENIAIKEPAEAVEVRVEKPQVEKDTAQTPDLETSLEKLLAANRLKSNKEKNTYQASFSLSLKIDAERNITLTHMQDKASQQEESWPGWNSERLVNFMERTASINFPAIQATPQAVATASQAEEPVEQPITVSALGLEVLPENSTSPTHFINPDEPYRLAIALDLGETKLTPETFVNYCMTVEGKRLGEETRQLVSQSEGSFKFDHQVKLQAKGAKVAPGFYRLEARIKLNLPENVYGNNSMAETTLKGELVHVL